MVLIYAFSNQWGTNISHRTLLELQKILHQNIEFRFVRFDLKSFFHKYILNSHYQLIIGLGDGPRYISKISLETQAKNSYNQQSIHPFSPILLDLNLPSVDIYDSHFFKISSNMGTYNCNFLAYKTQLYLNQHSPDTYHLFLHLPPQINSSVLAKNITDLLINNQMLK